MKPATPATPASLMGGTGGLGIDSVPNSPASISHLDTEDEKAHKAWKKSIMLVWRNAANHKYVAKYTNSCMKKKGYTEYCVKIQIWTTTFFQYECCS